MPTVLRPNRLGANRFCSPQFPKNQATTSFVKSSQRERDPVSTEHGVSNFEQFPEPKC